jgi:hypothetical protein
VAEYKLKIKMSNSIKRWCHREDDDDKGNGPCLPSIAESMGDVPVSKQNGSKFLAYARYDEVLEPASDGDPLQKIVCLNDKNATKLARALLAVERDSLKLLRVKLGKLTTIGAEALGQAIGSRPKLQYLIIEHISKTQGPQFMASLLSGIAQSPSIKTIRLESNCATTKLEPILSSLQSLDFLLIQGSCHLPSLCEGLKLTSSLTTLRITRQMIDVDQMQLFSTALSQCLSIKSLTLTYAGMDDERLMILLEHWRPTSLLRYLDVSYNDITAQGAIDLLRAAIEHPMLKKVFLTRNQQIDFAGIHMIANEIPNLRLMTLDISECFRTKRKGNKVKEQRAVDALTDAVQSNFTLCELGFSFGNERMWFYLELNRLGRHLFTMNHGLASTVWCHIFEKCGRIRNPCKVNLKASLVNYFLREQPHLVAPAAPIALSSRKRPRSAIM